MIRHSWALLILVGIGCTKGGGGSNNFSLAPEQTGFAQELEYNNKIDVLWVIDNSPGMGDYQVKIAEQADSLINFFVERGFDFQMAATTTDMRSSGERGKFLGIPSILTPQTPGLVDLFRARIAPGNSGSGTERGLEAMKLALTPGQHTSTNGGFVRSDAALVIVFVSSEDDWSVGNSIDYIDFLNNLKPIFEFGAQGWLANYIGIIEDSTECRTLGEFSDLGYRYMDIVGASNGVNQSICSSELRTALENIRERISGMIMEYKLAREPVAETIVVTIDGVVVPNDAVNGWTYHPDRMLIRFHGSWIPKANETVKIDYQPLRAK
ncbi:MAG: hypothetical protein COT74_06600 [Bdellovibrionales bacterium CG10_big_fil_rev_8_21_14_0_10_45_34]|nr:MAG: hypothetical protein COT74_06600 [Bdellovibrionales bacterium CG10_big_fil_rev_8_21_14_0_10_45_34]